MATYAIFNPSNGQIISRIDSNDYPIIFMAPHVGMSYARINEDFNDLTHWVSLGQLTARPDMGVIVSTSVLPLEIEEQIASSVPLDATFISNLASSMMTYRFDNVTGDLFATALQPFMDGEIIIESFPAQSVRIPLSA